MTKRLVTLMMTILLLSYAPILNQSPTEGNTAVESLNHIAEKVEISPDPNSIQDLGAPQIYSGFEDFRATRADSSIGVYTQAGLLPAVQMSVELANPRNDLAIVLIDGEVGLWDARQALLEAADVKVRSTIPPSGFLVQATPESISTLSQIKEVEAVHEVPAGLLVHPDLRMANGDQTLLVEVLGWKNSDLVRQDRPGMGFEDSLNIAASLWLQEAWSPEEGRMWGMISHSEVADLARHSSVAYIAPMPLLVLHNDQARVHMGINSVETTFITGLNGSGQKIAVGDSGLDDDHGDFTGRIAGLTSVTPGDSSTADLSDGHGTHVACTVMGDGFRSSGTYRGVAPEAQVYFQAMEDDDTGQLYSYGINSMLNSAYNNGARLHTNSWGAGSGGGSYSTQSEDADSRTSTWDQYWSYQGMTVLFAAGNERNEGVSPPGTAKNVITIGGHKNRYSGAPDEMYYWSSRGPTDDGRIKPDLVAPGDYVRSCKSQEADSAQGSWSNNWYLEYSGTSMSTPAAAGASALVREYLMEVIGRQAPQGALIKGLLILGAQDMGTRDIPNNDEGWGRLNLVESLIPDSDVGIFVDDRSRLSSGQTSEYSFDITRAGEPMKVVLTWSDYPGSSSSTTQLRNDLDLEVISPNGQITYKGNAFVNGRSVNGGTKDSTNNVEVVLIDNAATGTWTVRVRDAQHGGSRTWQPYALAVRGVNVNDLSPDPTFVQNSFEISSPIPQVGEEVDVSVIIQNQGAGSVADLSVIARADSNLLGTHQLSMSPGESAVLEWNWTPTQEGDVEFTFHIDPSDTVEEVSETNNYLTHTVIVSAPGVRVSTEQETVTLGDASDSSTTWQLSLMNTALFETNATIEVSDPVRMQDGVQYDWFTSFTSNTFNLEAAETELVSLTMVHPAPPPPGLYSMVVTGTDVENSVTSELAIFFDVPVLAGAEIVMPGEQFLVSPLESTELQILIFNEGNGAQAYDVELVSPAGWHLGFDTLGAFAGSSHGSTGTMARDAGRTVDITINPPGAMIPAESVFDAAIIIHSRVSSDSWSEDISLVVKAIDEVSMTPSSDGAEHDISPDALLEIEVDLSNLGNRMLDLQPYVRNIPGGWTVSGGLNTISIPAGESGVWSVALQGNGVAVSGDLELRFATDDGFYVDWNRTLNVLSGAIPSLSFHMVALPDGTVSDYPLGVGSHPVGEPGFDLAWTVTNQGSTTWRPTTYLEVPDDDWSSSCSAPSTLSAGASSTVWCTVVIPLSAEASSEPIVTLVMQGEGVEVEDSISLLVESVARVSWTLNNQPTGHEGYPTTLYIDLQNTGNSEISHILQVSGPDGWAPLILDGVVVNLRPGETRSLDVGFTPNSGDDGILVVELADADDVEAFSFSVEIDVLPAAKVQGTSILETLMIAVLVLALVGGGLYVYSRRGGDSSSLIQTESLSKIADSFGLGEKEEGESSGIPCWICSQDITLEAAWACSECGARYHRAGQVQGCDVLSMGNCLHCDAPSDDLVEA
ncbi:MAG: S8 family serine peptidase [Candidatus Thalassarchaeum sp.]|nr:S8 family serine peptidase [Candidatus Thalassarchaeum sp.]